MVVQGSGLDVLVKIQLLSSRLIVGLSRIVIIIMEICKAPTLRLKALNKDNTHGVHRDVKRYQQLNKS